MRRSLIVLVTAVALAGALVPVPVPAQASNHNPFGVMIDQAVGPAVAQDLGVEYARVRYNLLNVHNPCPACNRYRRAGIDLVITLKYNAQGAASTAAPDLITYKTLVRKAIDEERPAAVVVENEMEAPKYFTGTPSRYLAMLKAACKVAGNREVPCADGGLMTLTVPSMVYQDYVDAGQSDEAVSYFRRVFRDDAQFQWWTDPANADYVRERAVLGHKFMDGFTAAGATHVNFHWYITDTSALAETVHYIQSETGLRVLTNEIGQTDTDPATTEAMMRELLSLGLDYVIWYSQDHDYEDEVWDVFALHEKSDGSLRPTGHRFKEVISSL